LKTEDKTEQDTIMIVDDSPTQLELLNHILTENNYCVITAKDAEEALQKLNFKIPDLLIIDYYLPGIKGDELAQKIKLNINTRAIPLIMLTVDDTKASEKHGLESGVDIYLPKYTDPDILVLKIKSIINKSNKATNLFEYTSLVIQNKRLLAIDDSPTYLEFLSESLKQEGFTVTKATNGKDALNLLKQNQYDCILVDLMMPEMDGIELCKKIINMRYQTLSFPGLLMLTIQDNKEDMARALEAGADDFVGKSNDISVIKARIKALLRRKIIQDENQKITEELKIKAIESEKNRIEKEAAESKAKLAEELQNTVKKLENEIIERKIIEQKLKRSNADLEQFAYMSSHDLQAPLVSIIAFSQLLLKDYQDKFTKESKEDIDFIISASLRMERLLKDLLNYSRVGKKITMKRISLRLCADQAILNLKTIINNADASIIIDDLPEVDGDETLLIQLYQNLINNALKFKSQKKTIIYITANHNGNNWIFGVKDNGIGIELQHLDKLFLPFNRLHSSEEYSGSGIGLAICKKVVQLHDGKIWVESEGKNKGTTFQFTLYEKDNDDEQ